MEFIEYNFSINLEGKNIIGIDESGVGDYFGPLTAAAVLIPHNNIEKIKAFGVKDSKKISDNQIRVIAKKLIDSKLILYSVYCLSPKGYNSLNKNYNSNVLKMFAHLNAYSKNDFSSKYYDYVFIDQYTNLSSIQRYYKELIEMNNWAKLKHFSKDVLLAQKGESISISVAAASILARNEFLNYMDNMNKTYDVTFPFGSSKNTKEFALSFFKKHNWDEKIMNETCKRSFKMNFDDQENTSYTLFDIDSKS